MGGVQLWGRWHPQGPRCWPSRTGATSAPPARCPLLQLSSCHYAGLCEWSDPPSTAEHVAASLLYILMPDAGIRHAGIPALTLHRLGGEAHSQDPSTSC